MARCNIIALHGPAGVGKTAVAGKLCRKLGDKSARVSVDYLRDMLCMHFGSGKMSDRYITLAKEMVPEIVKDLKKRGYHVVVEIAPPTLEDKGKTDHWLALQLKALGGKTFLLHAPIDVVLKRNKKRKGEFGQGNLGSALTRRLHAYCEKYLDHNDYVVIDTSRFGGDKTASVIMSYYR